MIYLDNAASTKVHPDAYEAMESYYTETYGNPSSIHRSGRRAERAVKRARLQVAGMAGASPGEIFFTSGGTESNNMALYGTALHRGGGEIVTTAIEHEAVLEPCRMLESMGFGVKYVRADRAGMIRPDDVLDALSDKTMLVSVMLANNEVGTVQPVGEISAICRELGIPLHSDAVQAVGKIPVDVSELGVDLLSISSHKINGPKGTGALYVRRGTKLSPMIRGGGQERGMRSGTENVPGIVGFGTACEMACKSLGENIARVGGLRDRLVKRVMAEIPRVTYNGSSTHRLPNNAHFTFLGVNGEDLIIKLDEYGIAASTGSACSVKTQKASHVLKAMGFSHEEISGSLRLSLGIFNTEQEIDEATSILKRSVGELRAVSPYKEKYGF